MHANRVGPGPQVIGSLRQARGGNHGTAHADTVFIFVPIVQPGPIPVEAAVIVVVLVNFIPHIQSHIHRVFGIGEGNGQRFTADQRFLIGMNFKTANLTVGFHREDQRRAGDFLPFVCLFIMEARHGPQPVFARMALHSAVGFDAVAACFVEIVAIGIRQTDPFSARRGSGNVDFLVDLRGVVIHPNGQSAVVQTGSDHRNAVDPVVVFVEAVPVGPYFDIDAQPLIGAEGEYRILRQVTALQIAVKEIPIVIGNLDRHGLRAGGQRNRQFIAVGQRETHRQIGIEIFVLQQAALRIHRQVAGDGAAHDVGLILALDIAEDLGLQNIVAAIPNGESVVAEVNVAGFFVYRFLIFVAGADAHLHPEALQLIRVGVIGSDLQRLAGIVFILHADQDVAVIFGRIHRDGRRFLAEEVLAAAPAGIDTHLVFARFTGGHGQRQKRCTVRIGVHPVGAGDPALIAVDERLKELRALHGICLDLNQAVAGHLRVDDAVGHRTRELQIGIDGHQQINGIAVRPLAAKARAGIHGIEMGSALVVFGLVFVVIAVITKIPAVSLCVIGIVDHPFFMHVAVAEIDLDAVIVCTGRIDSVFKAVVQSDIALALFVFIDGDVQAHAPVRGRNRRIVLRHRNPAEQGGARQGQGQPQAQQLKVLLHVIIPLFPGICLLVQWVPWDGYKTLLYIYTVTL